MSLKFKENSCSRLLSTIAFLSGVNIHFLIHKKEDVWIVIIRVYGRDTQRNDVLTFDMIVIK